MSKIPNKNSGVAYVGGNPVKIVSLLTPDADVSNSPLQINYNYRDQVILADPFTGAPLDLVGMIANVSAGAGGSTRRKLAIRGSQILDENFEPVTLRGVSDFRWDATDPADFPLYKTWGANCARYGIRWRGLYATNTTDAYDPNAPGFIDPAHLARLVAQTKAAYEAGLYSDIALDSNCGQNGAQNSSAVIYCMQGATQDYPYGRNVWTDSVMRSQFVAMAAYVAAAVSPYTNLFECMPEPSPNSALGITDQQIIDFYVEVMDAILAVNPSAIFIIGAQTGYNPKRVATVYIPGRTNIIYTGNLFDFPSTGDGSNAARVANFTDRLQPLLALRRSNNVPIVVQQFGVKSVNDPAQVVLSTYINVLNVNGVPWFMWEDKDSTATDQYGIRYQSAPGSSVYVTKTAVLAAVVAGFAASTPANTSVTAPQTVAPGFTVLVLTASAGGARANNIYGVSDPTTYSRTAGVVQFDCASFPDADTDRYIKIASSRNPRLTAHLQVISATAVSGKTRIVAQELFAATNRPDIAAGSITPDGSMLCHDLQASTNTHSQFAKLIAKTNGALTFINVGIGGSNTATWQDSDLRSYVEQMPFCDFGIFDFGIGNDMTAPTISAPQVLAQFDDDLTWAEKRVRQAIIVGVPGARLGGDGSPVANPQTTVEFATLQIINHYLRSTLATRHTSTVYLDSASRFARASMYGSADTTDLVRGEAPMEFFEDGGIHLTPTGSDEIAVDLAAAMLPIVSGYQPFSTCHPDYIFSASPTVADEGGTLYNPNLMYGWHGAVATASVTYTSYIVGTGIQGTTCDGSGFSGSMLGTLSVVNGRRGNREMRFAFNDPRPTTDTNPNPSFNFYIRNVTAHPLVDVLNYAGARGIDLDWFGDFGAWGFAQDSILSFDISLVGVSASVTRKIASIYCDDGIDGMTPAHRAWTRGFNGVHRAGGGRIRVPARTYTDAYILVSVGGTPLAGQPIGDMVLRIGEQQLRRRDLILPPADNEWA